MLADLLPKADIAAMGLCEEKMSKPFVEDLHEMPEERARLETERDEILCQLSEDVDFDFSRVRNYLGPNSVCGMVCAGCRRWRTATIGARRPTGSSTRNVFVHFRERRANWLKTFIS